MNWIALLTPANLIRAGIVALILLLGADDARLRMRVSGLKLDRANAEAALAQATAAATEKARVQEAEFAATVAGIDSHYQEVIGHAQEESDRLTRELAAGTVRLRPAARCLAAGMSANPGAPGSDHGAAASGSADAGLAVRAVRIGDDADDQLKACQAYARAVSQEKKK